MLICISAILILSRNKERLLKAEGYTYYTTASKYAGKVRWRCYTHIGFGCTAVVYSVANEVIATKGTHNHPPVNLK